jgi:ATP diphosphatase
MSPIEKLRDVMAKLRDPQDGCPWDVDQDFSTIAPYTIEEAYEVADAIARDDMGALRDELGDLLFQVVFHARMAEELGHFDFKDVVVSICDKLIRRHPHVFGSDEERARGHEPGAWERIKAAERARGAEGKSALDGIAGSLPALKRSQKIGDRAAAVGFDWPDTIGVRAKIEEELEELMEAEAEAGPAEIHDELGDLLFTVVNLARHLEVDAEQALSDANRKFERRFRVLEASALEEAADLRDLDLDELESRWQMAKKATVDR